MAQDPCSFQINADGQLYVPGAEVHASGGAPVAAAAPPPVPGQPTSGGHLRVVNVRSISAVTLGAKYFPKEAPEEY